MVCAPNGEEAMTSSGTGRSVVYKGMGMNDEKLGAE